MQILWASNEFRCPWYSVILRDDQLTLAQDQEVGDESLEAYLECGRDRLDTIHELGHFLLLRVAADAECESHFLANVFALSVGIECCQHLDAISDSTAWRNQQ